MVPFFWTRQFGVSLKYVGHARNWDTVEIDGSLDAKDWMARLKRAGKVLAVVSVSRDLDSLRAWANARLGKTQRLPVLEILETLPRSAIGKVLKRELRDRYAGLVRA